MLRRYMEREINQWMGRGLVNEELAARLLADYDRRHKGFSLSGILAVLAAVLFGAAVIALIAANWDGIARLLRVAMIFGLIVFALGVGVVAHKCNRLWICEAALVFAVLVYGAGIALVGQMYHLSRDEASFMLSWASGALVVAIGFSSYAVSFGAGILSLAYMSITSDPFGFRFQFSEPWMVLLLALMLGVSALRAHSTKAGHLAVFMLLGWLLWLLDWITQLHIGYLLVVMGVAAFTGGALLPKSLGEIGILRHGSISTYGTVFMMCGLGVLQINMSSPTLAMEIAVASVVLIVCIVVLAVSGGANSLIRRLIYFAFACETIYLVSETLGSLLRSAGFLFVGGLVLSIIAFVVMKIEKRMRTGEGRS